MIMSNRVLPKKPGFYSPASNGRAANIPSGYELNLTGSEPGKAGFIDFVECPSIGSNCRGVECFDDLGLALLQKRSD